MVWSLLNRADTQVSVAPDRNPLFVTLSDGGLRNGYTVKIANKLQHTRLFKIGISGLPAARLQFVEFDSQDPVIDVAPAEVRAVKFFVSLTPSARKELKGESTLTTITVTDTTTGHSTSRSTTFSGPAP
jgi:polyferredoxin